MPQGEGALPIPDDALRQHILVLGKTRSGKSSTVRLVVERLLADRKPVCIIDPKGDWWGLKSSGDGKSAGYPVVIFGGAHADVPIDEHSGAAVAELVATGNRPCIIDLGGWQVAPRTRFFVAFADALFRHTRGARWLVIDECHNFAPQAGRAPDPTTGAMIHWANRLASEGAGKGVTLISASQRPQKVHKDYVTSHETLIAKRTIHPLDRAAVKDWIDGCGDPQHGKEVVGSLAGMPRERGWVWSPEIGFGPELVTFPMFSSYDSFKPQPEGGAKLKGWASVDLDEVRNKLAATVAEAKANDPKELKAKIARLEAEVQKLSVAKTDNNQPDPDALEAMELAGFARGRAAYAAEALGHIEALALAVRDAEAAAAAAVRAVGALTAIVRPAATQEQPRRAHAAGNGSVPPLARPASPPQRPSAPAPAPSAPAADDLGPERKLLSALAAVAPAGMTESQWAVSVGMKRTGGSWRTYKSRLRVAGRISQSGNQFYASARGLADIGGQIERLPSPGPALVDFWCGKVGGGPSAILREVVSAYPSGLSKDEVAARVGMEASGGSFRTYLSRLRSTGLVVNGPGGVVLASGDLMP